MMMVLITQFVEWVHSPKDEKIHQPEAGVLAVFHTPHLEHFGSMTESFDFPPSTTN